MSNQSVFSRTGSLQPRRSAFDLSYEKKFTADMGLLYPIVCDEMVPGDYWKMGNQTVVRLNPLVAPMLHKLDVYIHTFFVPYRILDEDFEDFITGGVDGDYSTPPPTWEPTDTSIGSLWDYLGFPAGVDPDGAYPLDYPRRAYNMIWNEYYRDQNLQDKIDLDNESILIRNWEKDYFTSSLPWQQRGTSPSLPLSGMGYADFTNAVQLWDISSNVGVGFDPTTSMLQAQNGTDYSSELIASLNKNEIDMSTVTTFDVNDLRLAFQIQKFMERNARAGARYTEFLGAHFGVKPRDERLQRPEYVGGAKNPIIVSEVLQTSSTDATTPQGNLAGHGLAVGDSFIGKYHAKEFGVMVGLMSIMPKPAYQQGINRQWLRQTRYDFYFPEFANLSEQAITNAEICAIDGDSTHNEGLFGYQGRYDEMRIKHDQVCGLMRTDFDYWHLGRIFDPASPPVLNEDFIQCVPDKRVFAAPSEPAFIISCGNYIKAFRPLPLSAEPGLIDHN
jgi:hypothetical protein